MQNLKCHYLITDLNAKSPGTVVLSKSVAVQTSNDMNDENKAEVIDESKLNCYRKSIATPGLHSRSDCAIIPAPPAVTSKPKATTVLLDGCRFPSNSCCFHGAYETPHRQTMSSARRDDCKKRKSHDRQWNQNVDTTALLLNDAWQFAGLHTRQRMAILSRHYRILYRRHRRLRKRYRHLRRSMRRTCHQSRYIQHQFQVFLFISLKTCSFPIEQAWPSGYSDNLEYDVLFQVIFLLWISNALLLFSLLNE